MNRFSQECNKPENVAVRKITHGPPLISNAAQSNLTCNQGLVLLPNKAYCAQSFSLLVVRSVVYEVSCYEFESESFNIPMCFLYVIPYLFYRVIYQEFMMNQNWFNPPKFNIPG